jgi:hypothetical protein
VYGAFPIKNGLKQGDALSPLLFNFALEYAGVGQTFYTCGTLNIVEESWRHTNPILHIVGEGEVVCGIDWPRQLLINRPQPKNVLFDVHNYPSILLCHLF